MPARQLHIILTRMWCRRGGEAETVVSTLASAARGPGFVPLSLRGKVSVCGHAFLTVKAHPMCHPSDRGGLLYRESHPLCGFNKEPFG